MNTAIQLAGNSALAFDFETQPVRVIHDESGSPWWYAIDVCRVLGLVNSRKALAGLDEDEKGVTNGYTPGGTQVLATINESGLHHLIFRSRKPEAKRFRKWVTSVVLPEIRTTGSFNAGLAQKQVDEIREAILVLAGRFGDEAIATAKEIGHLQGQVKALESRLAKLERPADEQTFMTLRDFCRIEGVANYLGKPLSVGEMAAEGRLVASMSRKAGAPIVARRHRHDILKEWHARYEATNHPQADED